MALDALAYTYTDRAHVEMVLSVAGVESRLDDDGDNFDNTTEALRMQDAINRATETINFYLWNRYSPDRIAQCSNLANQWAADLASYYLCRTRGNPVPESIIEAAREAEERLEKIYKGRFRLPGVPMRRNNGPTYDNLRIDVRYRFRVIRVEGNTSSQQPTTQPRDFDLNEAFGANEY